MNLYDTALQIFLKRMPPGYVNDSSRMGFISAAVQSIEAAELFLRAVGEHKQAARANAADERQLELPFPEETI